MAYTGIIPRRGGAPAIVSRQEHSDIYGDMICRFYSCSPKDDAAYVSPMPPASGKHEETCSLEFDLTPATGLQV